MARQRNVRISWERVQKDGKEVRKEGIDDEGTQVFDLWEYHKSTFKA